MEGERVSGSLSGTNKQRGAGETVPRLSYGEILERACPQYLNMGMTLEQYWHGDPRHYRFYRKAYEQRISHENYSAWLQGKYVFDAIVAVAPVLIPFSKGKLGDYPARPYPLTPEEKEEQELEKMKQAAEALKQMTLQMNKRFEEKQQTEGVNDIG